MCLLLPWGERRVAEVHARPHQRLHSSYVMRPAVPRFRFGEERPLPRPVVQGKERLRGGEEAPLLAASRKAARSKEKAPHIRVSQPFELCVGTEKKILGFKDALKDIGSLEG